MLCLPAEGARKRAVGELRFNNSSLAVEADGHSSLSS